VGGEYKRTVALIRLKRDMPQCQKCYTFADYKPPVKVTTTVPRPAAFPYYPLVAAGCITSHLLSTTSSSFC